MPRAEWLGARAEVLAIHQWIRQHPVLGELAEEAAFELIYRRRPRRASWFLGKLANRLPEHTPLREMVAVVARRLSEYHLA